MTAPDRERVRESGHSLAHVVARSRTANEVLKPLANRGLIPRSVWTRLPAPDVVEVSIPEGASFRYVAGGYDAVARELYWRGLAWHEGASVRPFVALARTAEVVVDVGANFGLYSLLACAANQRARVIAFEPVPESAERVRHNAALNEWSARVDVREVAVSDEIGSATFHIPFGPTPASASLNARGFSDLQGRLVNVAVTTLDAALDGVANIGLAKIDVENFEHLILAGMRLRSHRPALIVECNLDRSTT